jgi:hypothetical protein
VNKKKQKNFIYFWPVALGHAGLDGTVPEQKFFGSFFQKRTSFLLSSTFL